MTVKYLDPYKDDPYAKLKGDKSGTYFSITFEQARIYPTDNGYVIAGYFTSQDGLQRSFKPERPIEPELLAVPLYDKEYEIRKKVGDDWKSEKIKPSLFEQAAVAVIAAHKDDWIGEDKAVSGTIKHLPDGMLEDSDKLEIGSTVAKKLALKVCTETGKLKPYSPASGSRGGFGKGGGYKAITPEARLAAAKAELSAFIKADGFTPDKPLGLLVDQTCNENAGNEEFLNWYFDTLQACLR